jgi:hypothetical protein
MGFWNVEGLGFLTLGYLHLVSGLVRLDVLCICTGEHSDDHQEDDADLGDPVECCHNRLALEVCHRDGQRGLLLGRGVRAPLPDGDRSQIVLKYRQ